MENRKNQTPTKGLDARAQNIDRLHLKKTAAIFNDPYINLKSIGKSSVSKIILKV